MALDIGIQADCEDNLMVQTNRKNKSGITFAGSPGHSTEDIPGLFIGVLFFTKRQTSQVWC